MTLELFSGAFESDLVADTGCALVAVDALAAGCRISLAGAIGAEYGNHDKGIVPLPPPIMDGGTPTRRSGTGSAVEETRPIARTK